MYTITDPQVTQHNFEQTKQNGDLPSQKQNVAIIGCGYVGKAIASHWYQKQDYSVRVTTTREERVEELTQIANQVMVMKTSDLNAVQSLVNNQNTVVISVAPISDRQVDAKTYAETYLPTAKNLATALKDVSSDKQIIYLSSCSIYGNHNGEWVNENSLVDTENEYSKVLGEAEQILLNSASEKVNVAILRLGGIYGSSRELSKRIVNLAGKTLPGNGQSISCWIHLDDIVAAIDFIHQNKLHGIYNLVNDLKLTSQEIFAQICNSQGIPQILWDATKPNFRSLNARVDNQKIKAAGYKLIYPDTLI